MSPRPRWVTGHQPGRVNSRLEILQKGGGDAAAHVTAHHVAAMYPVLPLFHDWPAFELSRHSQRFRWLSGTSNWKLILEQQSC
jgi:hypothetical protein